MSFRFNSIDKDMIDEWILPLTIKPNPLNLFLSRKRKLIHYDSFTLIGANEDVVIGLNTYDGVEGTNMMCLNHFNDYSNFQSLYWDTESFLTYKVNNEENSVKKESCFKVSSVSSLSSLKEGDMISKSDLALQIEDKLIQFKYLSPNEENKKTIIKPGTWSLTSTNNGLKLEAINLAKKRLLLSATNTSIIMNEADCFFSNLDVYRELERPLKRGILLYSQPGLGKSATIGHFCDKARIDDPGTVVIIWPTAKIEAYQVEEFLASESEYDKSVTRVILVLEDIGGGEVECGRRAVDSSLLNLLDGVTVTFSLPTFIIATTNHPDNLLKSLADRPGRFDLLQELLPPSAEERIKLLEFISKRELTQEEKDAVSAKEANTLSIAHLDEIVVRSRLHKKTIIQTLKEILKHREFMGKNFDRNERTMGLGVDDDL